VLLLADITLGLLLALAATFVRSRRSARRRDPFGEVISLTLTSFALAVLLVEGLLPGFWLIVSYSLHGGALEDHLLPGATVGSLLRALALGLVVSLIAGVRTYVWLLSSRRKR
jgi:hypothetical protein